jgi:hypothetical protein
LFHDKSGSVLTRKIISVSAVKEGKQKVTNFKIFPHFLCYNAHANAGEIIDGEASVLGNVHREHTDARLFHFFIFESLRKCLQAHGFHHLVHHNFDEDTTARCRIILIYLHAFQHRPRNRITGHQVSKEAGNVAQTVGLVAMDGRIIVPECCLETIRPDAIKLTKSFTDESIEVGV